jgi:hypothetical protein
MTNIDNFPKSHKFMTVLVRVALVSVVCHGTALPGFENNGRGTRPIALANAYVAVADDPWAAYYNPAGLARVKSLSFSTFISPALFGMTELQTACVGATLPTTVGGIGVVFDQFGFDLYKETSIALAFGSPVNDWIALGATIHLQRVAIERYGSCMRSLFDVGGIASLTDDVRVGWSWTNVTQTSVGMKSAQYPQIMSMGVCYEITEHSRLAVELEKDIRYPIIKKFGFEQDLLESLSVRLGLSDNPDKCSCGLGVRTSGFEFSYAGYSHSQLGWTHQVELSVIILP